ncbi:MAG: NAD(P)-dependent glycerol-3-phosphate dehydrogenase [Bryobacteraceae bacterium]|nr:NAD(P)-dependent glycerol-3-phosphate dehydrogenase [Bryobacteraceae bacterium]
MSHLQVVGAGSWGTALAIVLSPRFARVELWARDPRLVAAMQKARENSRYLPGFPLPDNVYPVAELTGETDYLLNVVPSQHTRRIWQPLAMPAKAQLVSASKGIEQGSLLRVSEVMTEVTGRPVAVLSGPSFAKEVAAGEPAAMVVAASDAALATAVQEAFSTPAFRLYTSADPIGVELGAALKNVIAIAAGVVQGLGLGSNTRAALIARGLAEITRLAVAMGAEARTLSGLAGLGDLVLTCTGELSRNRRVGIELAQGKPLTEVLRTMGMVAEGVDTTAAALELAARCGVEMPIAAQVARLLRSEVSPAEAIRQLMARGLKGE